ncbi:MAG: LysR family transcriptional regulator, partial [Intestinibacter sp.]
MTQLEIEAFLNIVKYGSITKAAEILYISQPALSRRIKSLENKLQYELFIRQKGIRNVILTPQGKAFIPIAEKWQQLWIETKGIKNLPKNTVFHIAATDSINTYVLPKVYKSFVEENTQIHLVVHSLYSDDCYKYVENKDNPSV